MNEEFVYIKLVTGEQLMGIKESEDDSSVNIKFPMLLKQHVVSNNGVKVSEQVVAGPYSLFVDSTTFHINKNHIVLNTILAERAIPHYVSLVREHEGITLNYVSNSLQWEDEVQAEETPTLGSLLNQLKDELKAEKVREEEEIEGIFIEGNDTLH